MPLDNFKEIVDKQGYRVDRDDREIFEKGIYRSNIGRGFSDYIEFILYDSNDNQLPQGDKEEMIRYISLTDENIKKYFLISKEEFNKKSNDAREYIIDTEQLIKEAGYKNGVFKTHTAIVNRRVGSERPVSEKAKLGFKDNLWIQEISPSRTELRVLPLRDENDEILPDVEKRYNIFLQEGQFYDDTIYYVNKFVRSVNLEQIVGRFLTLKGNKETGRKYRDLILKEFKIDNWELFLNEIRELWIESVGNFVNNREWRLDNLNYGESLSTIPEPDLSISKIKQIVTTALINAIEKFLPKRDIQERSILTTEEQESYDKIRTTLKRLTGKQKITNNDPSGESSSDDENTEDRSDEDDGKSKTIPPPVGNDKVEVLIFFVGFNLTFPKPVDVRINNKWFRFAGWKSDDPRWDVRISGTRGKIVIVDSPITSIYFNEKQIVDSRLGNDGFGQFTVKLQRKQPNTDLRGLRTDVPKGHIQHWSSSWGAGGMWTKNTFNIDYSHQNGLDFPHFTSNDVLTKRWSETGKLVVRCGGAGKRV